MLAAKKTVSETLITLDNKTQLLSEYEPIVVSVEKLSLADAIRLTLHHNPDIHLQRKVLLNRLGNLQTAKGKFDLSLQVDLNGAFLQQELTPTQIAEQREVRQKEQDSLDNFIEQRDKIQTKIDSKNPISEQTNVIDALIENESDLEKQGNLSDLREEAIAIAVQALEEVVSEFEKSITESKQRIADLGNVPKVNRDYTTQVKLALKKPLENGAQLTSKVELSSSASNYRGKSMENAPLYRSIISFVVDYPFGKGSGFSSRVGKVESQLNYQASKLTLQHTIAISLFKTMSAYWTLVAAQERLKLLQISASLQHKLVELSQAQVSADIIARAELSRVLAREATIGAALAQGRQAAIVARMTLSEVMGVIIEELKNAPEAKQGFPVNTSLKSLEQLKPEPFIEYAIQYRPDYQAAQTLENSRYALLKAARIDLAPQSDLQLEFGYTGIHQDSSIASGIESAFLGNISGPSLKSGYKLEWSFANNSAKGNLLSAEAIWQRNQIIKENLARTLKTNVVQVLSSLIDSKKRLELSQQAADYYSQSMKSELIKFKLGHSTLINTILTEEYLTNAVLDLVAAKEQYIQLVTRLRYETANILTYESDQINIDSNQMAQFPDLKHLSLESPTSTIKAIQGE